MAKNILLSSKKATQLWEQSIKHLFVEQFIKGDLPDEKFREYIIQDKIFCEDLRSFVCQVLADCPDAKDFEAVHALVANLQGYGHEADLFKEVFSMLKIKQGDLRPHPTTEAFAGFLWRVGTTGTILDKLVVMYAINGCYMDWADRAVANKQKPKNQTYAKWIEIHTSENMGKLVEWIENTLIGLAGKKGENLTPFHHEIFEKALKFEIMFFDTAFKPGSLEFPLESSSNEPSRMSNPLHR